MPIDITSMSVTGNQPAAAKVYVPKFFSDKLTGRGGKTPGLLSQANNPPAVDPNLRTQPNDKETRRYKFHQNMTTVTHLPMAPLDTEAFQFMEVLDRPDFAKMLKLADSGPIELWMDMNVQAVTLEETEIPADPYTGAKKHTDRVFRANYEVTFYEIYDKTDPACKRDDYHIYSIRLHHNAYWQEYVTNPMQELAGDIVHKLLAANWVVDQDGLKNYLMAYDLYANVSQRSETWQTAMDSIMSKFIKAIQPKYQNDPNAQRAFQRQVKYLMSYNIPLEQYRTIYQDLQAAFPMQEVNTICKQNLNLLLSNTMNKLSAIKPNIPGFTPPANAPAPPAHLSPQQLAAVSCTDPLILVQSGAGTGKSTMILGRIDYMVACGVNPKDIMILSFTNAAADHIRDKNPNLKSMTIAKMIHTIYELNFPDHELSETATLINTLDIYYPKQPGQSRGIVDDFQRYLHAFVKKDPNAYTEMNNFIENNYDEVITVLNTICQTTLELEIIICYQRIDYLTEPANISSKYLIIDEVQDNSVFEFIYMLRYITKHQEPLFLVGDCSQTLYEFRSSNPRALNILEASQVFTTYQLTTNYRSNQEILDFANVALDRIEANQYARIRLHANSLIPVTEQSFMDKVQLNYIRIRTQSELVQNLPSIFLSDVRPYIDACLARNEQIAFLAYKRQHVALFKEILSQQYPNQSCVSMVPEKSYPFTAMSQFIRLYWDGITFMPYTAIPSIIFREIMAHLNDLSNNPNKAKPFIQQMLTKWITEQDPILDLWIQQAVAGQITDQELLDNIKDNMLKFEIKQNALKQAIVSNRNQEAKKTGTATNANFLLSTIHSAKGLEFQNVVILYMCDSDMNEADKRMYYVAMTRAMISEYILACGTTVSSRIQSDYVDILSKLHAIAPSPNSYVAQLQASMRGKGRIQI